MEAIRTLILALKPDTMMPVAFVLAIFGMGLIAWVARSQSRVRETTRNRLSLNYTGGSSSIEKNTDQQSAADKARAMVPKKILTKASDFYANSDPVEIMRIRQRLIRAGFMEPGAVGIYFALRMVIGLVFFVVALPAMIMFSPDTPFAKQLLVAAIVGLVGNYIPNIVLNRIIVKRTREYRSGFPDFMDLMIVCADAGMSMEAAIERVSREITLQYPALAQNLAIITIELRAGRQLADALKSLSDRLGLDEVRSFATLLQQSKELGTSLSDTLRVFSDEMRHKRMSKAEEKAHALPAKMTVPVTIFILPVIMLIATIPAIVNMMGN